ncbi:MAG: type II secretion system GspH family protein [Candidatus Peribacteria bacterium]|jgi:prepilin-type N-terminal cleavage/methylation domain-containing protein|nr:type II secretion system GspH family protein [Candidatus Peribacteria bacterium]
MIKKAFTLVETMIVLVIIGILAVVLTQSYLTISKIAFTIEQEKTLSEEALMLTQMIQSITEDATIDYDKYKGTLANTNGFVEKLYLTGELRSGTSIFRTGNCLALEGGFGEEGSYGDPAEIIWNNS